MRVPESCAECLYDKQRHLTDDPDYLREVRAIIDGRSEEDIAPWLIYLFGEAWKRRHGSLASYGEIKRRCDSLVLSMEDAVEAKIEASPDPLMTAMVYARTGNYIDFGAMNHVDMDAFISLLQGAGPRESDRETMASFRRACGRAERFLLIADNCGELVLDRLFLRQLKKAFPQLSLTVMVRGGEVLNDATLEDALRIGLDREAALVSSGMAVAGTVYGMLPADAKEAFDRADVILAKGQGNYESLCGMPRHIYFAFLCKCELFTRRFGVPLHTGLFVEQG